MASQKNLLGWVNGRSPPLKRQPKKDSHSLHSASKSGKKTRFSGMSSCNVLGSPSIDPPSHLESIASSCEDGEDLNDMGPQQPKKRQIQSFLDVGQKEFDKRTCPKCGMVYSFGHVEDEKDHQRYCSSVEKISFGGWAQENVVVEYSESKLRILYIDPEQRKRRMRKIDEVLHHMAQQFGQASLDINTSDDILLAIEKEQVVGCCVMERLKDFKQIKKVEKIIIDENKDKLDSSFIDLVTSSARVADDYVKTTGISYIWVARSCQRKGLGTALTDAASRVHNSERIAFSQPTAKGLLLAKSISKSSNVFIY